MFKELNFKDQKGQMLAEILVAVVLAGIIIGGIALSTGTSVSTSNKIRENTKATYIIQRILEEIKMISESNWLILYCPPSGICPGNKGASNRYYISNFTIQNGSASTTLEGIEYGYYFYIENVNRDSQQNIVSSGGSEDPSTQKITVVINWAPNNSLSISEYIMRITSASFSDRAWNSSLTDSGGIYTNAAGYYATTSGTLVIQNGTLSLNPTTSGGSLTSVIFDTGRPNGVAFNSIKWKGSLPTSSRVRFQFASSNSTTTWNFIGPDGTVSTYYEAAGPDQFIPISLQYHNNHRYFRYKIYLDPTSDYSSGPTIYRVVITYSP